MKPWPASQSSHLFHHRKGWKEQDSCSVLTLRFTGKWNDRCRASAPKWAGPHPGQTKENDSLGAPFTSINFFLSQLPFLHIQDTGIRQYLLIKPQNTIFTSEYKQTPTIGFSLTYDYLLIIYIIYITYIAIYISTLPGIYYMLQFHLQLYHMYQIISAALDLS